MADATQTSIARFERIDLRAVIYDRSADGDVEMVDDERSRLIIALDFGTTFSSVAYARVSEAARGTTLGIMNVKCIANYPDDRSRNQTTFSRESREDVPTELWYTPKALKLRGRPSKVSKEPAPAESENEQSEEVDSSTDSSSLTSEGDDGLENGQEPSEEDNGRQEPESLFWGFGVQRQLGNMDIQKDDSRRLSRFKLMLDKQNTLTTHIWTELGKILKKLKKMKLIKEDEDIIGDYLTQLFKHTKEQLQDTEDLDSRTPIEFVLCVPAVWPSKACRIMQTAMATAIQRSGLGSLEGGNISNLFIISEPEAAAACVLAENNDSIAPGDTIVILDAGGGTVDGVTYRVTNSEPLRLSEEVVAPGSRLCGASYINERLEKHLRDRLKRAKYLEKNGKTINSIVEAKVMDFENVEKRMIDLTNKDYQLETIYIDDLQPDAKKGFDQNRLKISRDKMKWIFKDSLKGAATVLREQLDMAKAKKHSVKKVLLIGGFGQSPYLRNYLRNVVANETNFDDRDIHFLTPRASATAVARGAVLRAYNKEDGPTRITQCSYGFLLTEPYEPEVYDAHRGVRCVIDKADGEKYVDKTINWRIQKQSNNHAYQQKGDPLEPNAEFPIRVKHTFPYKRETFKCREELYVSDSQHESHYRRTHTMNTDAEFAGAIDVNMTFLKDQGLIEPTEPSFYSKYRGTRNLHWEVTFDLVMIVDGRNLRYEARWPPTEDGEEPPTQQAVQARGQICIAANFRPGTA